MHTPLMNTMRNTKADQINFLLSLAAGFEARIESGDLRGATVEQLRRGADHYRNVAAVKMNRGA